MYIVGSRPTQEAPLFGMKSHNQGSGMRLDIFLGIAKKGLKRGSKIRVYIWVRQ